MRGLTSIRALRQSVDALNELHQAVRRSLTVNGFSEWLSTTCRTPRWSWYRYISWSACWGVGVCISWSLSPHRLLDRDAIYVMPSKATKRAQMALEMLIVSVRSVGCRTLTLAVEYSLSKCSAIFNLSSAGRTHKLRICSCGLGRILAQLETKVFRSHRLRDSCWARVGSNMYVVACRHSRMRPSTSRIQFMWHAGAHPSECEHAPSQIL